MKAVLISIKPKWCKKIMDGEKTVELRKTKPRIPTPFKCYIYCTSGRPDLNIPISQERLMRDYLDTGSMQCLNCPLGNGKVIGEFVCDNVCEIDPAHAIKTAIAEESCVSRRDIHEYLKSKTGYGWHISDLKIYEQPKDLSEFCSPQDTYCEKGLCGGCPYDEAADVHGEYSFDCEWRRPLMRPPQSWCYVAEEA